MATQYGTSSPDVIYAGPFGDTIVGYEGNDTLYGGAGGDYMFGNTEDDILVGYGGFDTLIAGQGNDFVFGNEGDDFIGGNEGNDSLYGGLGNDSLYGGYGDDIIEGNEGNDYIQSNEGNDTISGGTGTDTVYFAGTQSRYSYTRMPNGTVQVKDLIGAGGTDVLAADVETLVFDSGPSAALNTLAPPLPVTPPPTGGGGGDSGPSLGSGQGATPGVETPSTSPTTKVDTSFLEEITVSNNADWSEIIQMKVDSVLDYKRARSFMQLRAADGAVGVYLDLSSPRGGMEFNPVTNRLTIRVSHLDMRQIPAGVYERDIVIKRAGREVIFAGRNVVNVVQGVTQLRG